MKMKIKNPLKVLSQHKFTLPQIIVIAVIVAGLAFTGGLMWRNYQKRLANEAAADAALEEAKRLSKLKAEELLENEQKEDDKKKEEPKPAPEPEQEPAETSSLYLVGEKASKGVNLSWDVKNLSVTQGFKLLLSKEGAPVYGSGHTDGVYVKDSASRYYFWGLTNGKTYYFRLCIYNGSGCSHYSNTIQVTAPYVAPAKPTGSITINSSGGSNPLSWSNSGNALYGYKLVWDTSSSPTYPGADYKAFFEKNSSGGSITGPAGTYYVRLCMYYEGGCMNYSNQVQVTIP